MTTQTATEPTQTIPLKGLSTIQRGEGPPGDPPDPRWFGGTGFPFNLPAGGGGGGGGGGDGGGGGAAGGGGGNPDDPGHRPKLSGKEPTIFDSDHTKAKSFFLEWVIYMILNEDTEVMEQVFFRTMLFLMFIKGPNVQEWVGSQVGWIGQHLNSGGRKTNEYLYDTVVESFNTAFTDTMSLQKAKAEFQTLKMEGGDLDTFIAKFERLARIAGYDLQNQMVLDQFGSGLTSGLYIAIVNGPDEPRSWTEWTRAAQKYQQKYLLIHSSLGMRNPKDLKSCKKTQTLEQWRMAWKKPAGRDPDAMDTTPGCTRARRINAEERA